jgi:tetratricopeptide (TPR) repeat protein
MTDSAFPDRLTQLRARWEADPTSRIFLQLAEEYRHMGRVKEALAVLEKGLREHPGYLSALVAKGRCHIELGDGAAARGVLERVVKQDATQMVANKLLVRAYLETGEPAKARERLDLYTLLNDSDPEIEELRRRVRALERPAPAEEPRRMDADPFSLEPPVARRQVAPAPDVFDIEPAPRPAAVPAPAAEEADGDLFPGLASDDSRRRYLEGLAAEGLFAFAVPEAEPAPAPVVPAPVSAGDEDLWGDEDTEVFDAPPLPAGEPLATATLGEIYLRQGHHAEAERIFREVLEREPDNAAARAGIAHLAALAEPEPAPEPVAPEAEPAPVVAREAAPLDARQLLAGFQPAPGEAGVTARKVYLLHNYLKRLRQGAERDVS